MYSIKSKVIYHFWSHFQEHFISDIPCTVSQPVVCHNYYFFSSSHCCNLVSPFSLASSPGLQLFIIEGLGTRLHSHAKRAVKFIIIIIVWNVHDQVYIFMLVILMHSALCIYFIVLNWCHDTASACLYSNCIVISIECNG